MLHYEVATWTIISLLAAWRLNEASASTYCTITNSSQHLL